MRVKILEKWKPVVLVPMNLPFRKKGRLRIERLGRGKRKRYVKKSSRAVPAQAQPLIPKVEAQKDKLVEGAKASAERRGAPFFNAPRARATWQTKFKDIVLVPSHPSTYFDWVGSRDTKEFKSDVIEMKTSEMMKQYPYPLTAGAIIEVGPKGRDPTHILLIERSEQVEGYAGYGDVPSGFIDMQKAPVRAGGEKVGEYQIPENLSLATLREVAEELFIRPSNHKIELPAKLKNAKKFKMHFLDKNLKDIPPLHPLSTPEMPIRMEPPVVTYGLEEERPSLFALYAIHVHATRSQVEQAMKNAPDKWEHKKAIWVPYNSKALLKELKSRTYMWDKAMRVYAKALAAKESKG